MRPSWVEIDLEAIGHNCRLIKTKLKQKTELMAIIKADAYGHGAIPVARKVLAAGADYLGVSSQEEALELRRADIAAPILILGFTPPEDAGRTVTYNLAQTIFAVEHGKVLNTKAKELNKKASVHLKIDTGMSRLGLQPNQETIEIIKELAGLPNLSIQGIYTHFADAGNLDKSFSYQQLTIFNKFLTELKQAGINIPLRHTANSAAILNLPESHLDLVRAGILLHGLHPFPEGKMPEEELQPAFSLKSRIIHLQDVDTGASISYGRSHFIDKPSLIATLPIGYADGISRSLSNRGEVLIKGKRAPIIGRVCMDQLMIDVTGIEGVAIWDEAVLIGKQGESEITVDELAEKLGTINYEIVCAISDRVPRLYLP